MAEKTSYIKIDRNITRWRWWKCQNTLVVFIWLLLNANVKDHGFEKEIIHRGQIATSVKTIEKQCYLSTMQVRVALEHLKSTGEITIKSTNRYQVITIVNYNLYQDVPTNKTTNKQQTDNKQITNGYQQYKNNKKGKKERIPPKSPTGGLAPSGSPPRGTDAFRAKSHLLLTEDEGTADDIPVDYREDFKTFSDYWRYRNQ